MESKLEKKVHMEFFIPFPLLLIQINIIFSPLQSSPFSTPFLFCSILIPPSKHSLGRVHGSTPCINWEKGNPLWVANHITISWKDNLLHEVSYLSMIIDFKIWQLVCLGLICLAQMKVKGKITQNRQWFNGQWKKGLLLSSPTSNTLEHI